MYLSSLLARRGWYEGLNRIFTDITVSESHWVSFFSLLVLVSPSRLAESALASVEPPSTAPQPTSLFSYSSSPSCSPISWATFPSRSRPLGYIVMLTG